MSESLIYGKNSTQRIVSIEIEDNKAAIYTVDEQFKTHLQYVSNRFWILSDRKLTNTAVRLNGNLHYKYGIQYETRSELEEARIKYRNEDIYSVYNPQEAFMLKDGFTYYKGLKNTEIPMLSFDIEGTGLEHNNDSKVLLISNTFRKNGIIIKKLFSYENYSNCGEMIDDWCQWVREIDPCLIIGHNIFGYDLPYMIHCADRYGYELKLGRDSSPLIRAKRESKFRVDGSRDLHYNRCKVYGRDLIDTMFLAYRYDTATKKYESYGLKSIIKTEGLEKEKRVHYDASQIRNNYLIPEEWEKIKVYCEDDSDDSLTLYDLMSAPFFYMTQMIPKTFQQIVESASGSQLNALMVRSYLQNRHSIPKEDGPVDYEGAISYGTPGIYANAVSFDIASLYPSVMLQYKIYSPEKDPNCHMLGLLEYLRAERLKNKKLAKETGDSLYKHLDTSQKILINSLYGFMGAAGLNFNYPAGAAEVTRRGRETLQYSIDWALSKGFTVPKVDTDSITIWKNGEAFNNDEVKQLLNEINGLLPIEIKFELDSMYDSIMVVKAKNYAYREGDKITVKGSALKASTKCLALKEMIKYIIKNTLYGKSFEEIKQLYIEYIKEASNVKDIKRWAARKTLSSTMMESSRTNETKVLDALEGSDYTEGDRFFVYYKPDNSLGLVENFDGEYNKPRLYKNIYDTISVFDTIFDIKTHFPNYSLKKNLKIINEIINVA
jgi:DNA polymerase elongation subunit (family B)